MIAAIALSALLFKSPEIPAIAVQYQGVVTAQQYRIETADKLKHEEHEAHLQHVTDLRLAAEAAAQQAADQRAAAVAAAERPAPAPVQQSAPVQPAPAPQPAAEPAAAAPPSGSSYQARVAMAESTDNPNAVNGDHYGLYQMTPTLWAMGGGSGSPQGASVAEQNQVFENIIAHDINGGTSNWEPYDGVQP